MGGIVFIIMHRRQYAFKATLRPRRGMHRGRQPCCGETPRDNSISIKRSHVDEEVKGSVSKRSFSSKKTHSGQKKKAISGNF
jgi:hypothetical protein